MSNYTMLEKEIIQLSKNQNFQLSIMQNKRLQKEIVELSKNRNFEFTLSHSNIQVKFFSTNDSPYAHIPINLVITISKNYPFAPCLISFNPIIIHPNITHEGFLDYPPFKQDWSAAYTIEKIILEIQTLFHKPFICEDIPFVSDKGKEEEDGLVTQISANPEALRLWQEEPETLREIVLSQI